uniref:Uncharacterized protein n=1 Tax=Arundo donax TaxID=35708 RepID=A0A0A9AL53_ARUDO
MLDYDGLQMFCTLAIGSSFFTCQRLV